MNKVIASILKTVLLMTIFVICFYTTKLGMFTAFAVGYSTGCQDDVLKTFKEDGNRDRFDIRTEWCVKRANDVWKYRE